jgi:elongator complex protein 2
MDTMVQFRYGRLNNLVIYSFYLAAFGFGLNRSIGAQVWTPTVGISGHFKAVKDLAWSPSGDFFVSVSLDQTSRLWGTWTRPAANDSHLESATATTMRETWHELARPQIHGYDLNCVAFYHAYGMASGADEKVIRIFEAPKSLLEALGRISGVTADEGELVCVITCFLSFRFSFRS